MYRDMHKVFFNKQIINIYKNIYIHNHIYVYMYINNVYQIDEPCLSNVIHHQKESPMPWERSTALATSPSAALRRSPRHQCRPTIQCRGRSPMGPNHLEDGEIEGTSQEKNSPKQEVHQQMMAK